MPTRTKLGAVTTLALCLVLPASGGCRGDYPDPPQGNPHEAKAGDPPSAHPYLSVSDLAKFQKGRPKKDILEDLHGRASWVLAGYCDGKAVMQIGYTLLPATGEVERGEAFIALFVDSRFEKFLAWQPPQPGEKGMFGSTTSLTQGLKRPASSAEELRKTVEANQPPPKQIDPGLTVAWLLLGPKLAGVSKADFRRNLALRDQFNGARLDLGMTEQEVERLFRAKPLAAGELRAGTCKVYGSNETFPIDLELHHANTVVIYRGGKANVIFSFFAGDWATAVEHAPKGIIHLLKDREDAAGKTTP